MSVDTCPSSLTQSRLRAAKRFAVLCAATFSLLALMLWIPSAMYLVAYERARPWPEARARVSVVVVTTLALGVLAFVVLVIHQDPRCWTSRAGVTTCASDTVSGGEAVGALGVMLATLVVAAWLGSPRQPLEPFSTAR